MEKLLKLLESNDETERRYAVQDLAEHKDSIVIDALIKCLEDPARAVAESAVESLIVIGGKEVCNKSIQLLYSENSAIRNYAIEILEKVGESDLEAVTMLLKDENKDVRKFAADIIGYIAEIGGEAAYLPLVKTLADENVNVASAAAEALGKLGNERAIPFLVKGMGKESWMQCNVVNAICEIGGEKAIAALREIKASRELSQESLFVLEQSLKHLEGIENVQTRKK